MSFKFKGDTYDNNTAENIMDALVGQWIGRGARREVYAHRENQDLVVKIQRNKCEFDNIIEWELWHAAGYCKGQSDAHKWLAKCHYLSKDGKILIQERTYRIHEKDYPKEVPIWMRDDLHSNFGRTLDGRFVAHDYAQNLAYRYGLLTKRMRKPNWRMERS